MMDDIAARLIKRLDALKGQRQVHESVWRDCYDHTYPLRGAGLTSDFLDAQSAKSRVARLLTSTATDSARTLASALMSGMTPPQAQWLDLGEEGMSDEERRWFSIAATVIWENIHAANFDAEGYEANLDVVCAGWFVLYVDEDQDEGGYNFQQWPISQCYVASTRKDGRVDTIFRSYQRTAAQAVSEFGENAVSDKIRKAARDKPDEKFELLHVIHPRNDFIRGARLAKNLPFASYHIELSGKKILRESGYHEFPCCVPRWMKIPGAAYGIGPVYDALPDIKELNTWLKMEKAAGDLAISGMWIAEDDGVLNPRTVTVGPRKIIVANSVNSMKPLLTGSDFNVAFTSEERLERRISKVLMADQLQPQEGPAMTATEVHVRVALIRQLLGPIYGRFQAEYLQPLIERCFGLALRAGAFPPIPQSLGGRSINVRYISPLARAQKLDSVTSIERLAANVGQLLQVSPEIVDNLDADAAIQVVGDALGVPAKILRTAADVQKIREQRAEQQQQAAQQQLMQQAGAAAADAGGKEAGVALVERMMGGGNGG